ncbi:GxxExxY protein [Niabella aquatica]
MIDNRYKYSDMVSQIAGFAMTVHQVPGNGFQEVIYQHAFKIEMMLAGISFKRESPMPIDYRNQQIRKRYVDSWTETVISAELKAKICLDNGPFAQAINYLETYNLAITPLSNFGGAGLNFKRLPNKKFRSIHTNHRQTNDPQK